MNNPKFISVARPSSPTTAKYSDFLASDPNVSVEEIVLDLADIASTGQYKCEFCFAPGRMVFTISPRQLGARIILPKCSRQKYLTNIWVRQNNQIKATIEHSPKESTLGFVKEAFSGIPGVRFDEKGKTALDVFVYSQKKGVIGVQFAQPAEEKEEAPKAESNPGTADTGAGSALSDRREISDEPAPVTVSEDVPAEEQTPVDNPPVCTAPAEEVSEPAPIREEPITDWKLSVDSVQTDSLPLDDVTPDTGRRSEPPFVSEVSAEKSDAPVTPESEEEAAPSDTAPSEPAESLPLRDPDVRSDFRAEGPAPVQTPPPANTNNLRETAASAVNSAVQHLNGFFNGISDSFRSASAPQHTDSNSGVSDNAGTTSYSSAAQQTGSGAVRPAVNADQPYTVPEIILTLYPLTGIFGIHKYYKKDIKWGLIYTFTIGLLSFGWLYDCVKILLYFVKKAMK